MVLVIFLVEILRNFCGSSIFSVVFGSSIYAAQVLSEV